VPDSIAVLRAAAGDEPALKSALAAAERLAEAIDLVHAEMEQHQNALADVPAGAFAAARRYTLCFAAAAVLGLWAHNHVAQNARGVWQDGVWLRTALDRLLVRLGEPGADDGAAYEQLLGQLCDARDEGELFSLFPLALAGGHQEQEHGTTTRMLAEGTSC
jgi:hypothetical protein